ncbi:hypothetical protein J2X11_001385 [Aeromicrobium panaciterrae]|uniref:BIG2 domain-containing protein n=1 Tax=Aeromicrobium panaciterrae TaxID=363861 RepID=A0ABU1UMZ0_9ACTN|nr:Ig-like domain-containing protein [Aeromicrobium panaciterrae]MDR7086546.1 hypothetical protein [Aeromicrobium panaciterrae]
MPRRFSVFCALALLATLLVPAGFPASADTQPRENNRYVNLDDPNSFDAIRPAPNDVSYPNGRRVEIYGSVGDNETGMDWRTVNAFASLVNSVPAGYHSYTTLFNSLYDDRSVSKADLPDDTGNYKWTVTHRDEVFSPTAAYINLANKYDTYSERKQYIHVLGAKESMNEAYAANSSLARLVENGAVDYRECAGDGGCLSGPNHLMHSKYGAFEKAKDSAGNMHDNVIWMTSSNLNGSSGSKKANISIAIYDDEEAFKAIRDGIYAPSIQVANGMSPSAAINGNPRYKAAITVDPATGVIAGMPTDSGITLLPSPRRVTNASEHTDQTDVEAAFLNKQADDNLAKPGCKVYAVHSLFNSTRAGVLDGLLRLKNQSCDIKIVLGDNAISDIVDGYFNMSEDLRELIGKVEFANVHDKTLSYKYGGNATAFGGASNFTGTSLEYDELAWRANDTGITDSVQEHSERIYQLARGQVTWTAPTSVAISPSSTLKVQTGDHIRLGANPSPNNALITNTSWVSDNPSIASVNPTTGVLTGVADGVTTIHATVTSPPSTTSGPIQKSKTATVTVGAGLASSSGGGTRANVPPTLTMDNKQAYGDKTDIVVTWGYGKQNYSGIVKLQYYSGGWKSYDKDITVSNGKGHLSAAMSSSKTWRAYGARLDKIDGVDVPNLTSKAMSNWSINTVRQHPYSSTPRLYATTMVKSGSKIPFLISWDRGGGVFRLQQRGSSGPWKTHAVYSIPSGKNEEFIIVPVLNTKYWRIATSTGTTKVSNTVKVAAK